MNVRARGLLGVTAMGLWVGVVACTNATGEHAGSTAEPLMLDPGNGSAPLFFGDSLPDKTLALTFDDGPGDHTIQLSQYLKSQNIRATFFINGGRITSPDTAFPGGENPNDVEPLEANPTAILAQVISDGHLIGNHTTTHRSVNGTNGPAMPAAQLLPELTFTDNIITAYVPDGEPLFFRPPYMDWDITTARAFNTSTMSKYYGPVDADMGGISNNYPTQASDWACWQGAEQNANGTPAGAAGTGFLTTTECGDAYLNEISLNRKGIILMHDPFSWASQNYLGHTFTWSQGNSVDMVMYMVPKLQALGYKFVRVDEVPAIKAVLPPCDASCSTCQGTKATQCLTCSGTSYFSSGSCAACDSCGAAQYQVSACTPTADTVCAACDASCATCSGAGATACTTCGASKFLAAGACTACSLCAAGSATTTACTATSDTVCGTCAAGTSAGAGATSCTPCASGTYSGAGAGSCTACGSCDDGNSCTVDACDAVLGCTHTTPDGGCPAVPDAGTSGSDSGTSGSSSSSGGNSDASAPAGNDDGGGSSSGTSAGPPSSDTSEGGGGCSIAHNGETGTDASALFFGVFIAIGLGTRRQRKAARANRI